MARPKPKGFYTDKKDTVHPVFDKHPHVAPIKKGTSSLRIPKRTVKQGSIKIKTQVQSPKNYDFSLLEKDPQYWYYEQDMFQNRTALAVQDNKVLGVVAYHITDDAIFIDKILVTPESRGKGIGSKLMKQLEIEAASLNKNIRADPLNDKAMQFFRKHGFTGDVGVIKKL